MKKRVKLTFPKRSVHMPITYRLAKDFNVAANIDQLNESIDWLEGQDIKVSLASREIVIDDAACVHCGLCTGVCPTEALSLNPESFQLVFARSRCIVCEQCIPTCPVQAISTNL